MSQKNKGKKKEEDKEEKAKSEKGSAEWCAALLALIQRFREAQQNNESPDAGDFALHDSERWGKRGKHHAVRNATFGQLAGDLQRTYDANCGQPPGPGAGAAGASLVRGGRAGGGHAAGIQVPVR